MIIRHEINLLNGTLVNTSTSSFALASELNLFDTSKYSGTLAYYVEVVATNTSTSQCGFSYNQIGGTTGFIAANTSTFTLFRSTAGTATNSDGVIRISPLGSAGTVTIKAARLVIIQDTGTDSLTASESQYEIGNRETAITVTTTNTLQPLSAPKYWKYNAANFDGTLNFYAECTYLVSSTTGNKTIVVQESSDLSTWATAATMLSVATGSTTAARVRSAAFTPKDGYYYRLAWTNSSTMSTVSLYNAKIIVDQQYLVESILSGGGGSQAINGFPSSYDFIGHTFTASESFSFNSFYLNLFKTGTPADNLYIEIRDTSPTGSLLGTSSNVAASTISSSTQLYYKFSFGSAISCVSGNTYAILVYRSGANDTSNYCTVNIPSSTGRNVWIRSGGSWSILSSDHAMQSYIPAISSSGVGITKLEEHYLLANTTLAAGTALQNFLTAWDSTEWSGVTNTYNHQIDSSASNTSVVEIDGITSAAQVSGSVVTSPNRYGISSAMTMPASQNIDVKATTNSGSIFGSRIIVKSVKSSSPPPTYTPYSFCMVV